jgi:hypothetical protein
MGTHGSPPTRVLEVPVKWTPASGPRDLIHNPGDLGRPQTTLSRLRKTCQACGASLSLDRGDDTASRSVDRGIHSVITEGDLPNL